LTQVAAANYILTVDRKAARQILQKIGAGEQKAGRK
jgi:hypothetical protein